MRTIVWVVFVIEACAQEPSVFRSEAQLVEIDVVVRGKSGPVTGLTKDDFTLIACKLEPNHPPCSKGTQQSIALFREVNGSSPSIPLPAGVGSNRSGGEPTTTVVLVDQLNTPPELRDYERLRVAELMKSIGDGHRIALYSLGHKLRVLQDFTDDPKKVMQAFSSLDPGGETVLARDLRLDGTDDEFTGAEIQEMNEERREITLEAIKEIVRHLEGVPGRKNLVWISQSFTWSLGDSRFGGPPGAGRLLAKANIAVYQVMVRRSYMPQRSWIDSTRSLGGIGFADAGDALDAVRAAEQDSKNYYVLGFYPASADLDGANHYLTLEVSNKALSSKGVAKAALDLRYRREFFAAKPGSSDTQEQSAISDVLNHPFDAVAIGLTAIIAPDPTRSGMRRVELTVDLAGAQLQRQNEHWVGSLQLSTRLESTERGVLIATPPVTRTVPINLTDAELAATRASGFRIVWPLGANVKPGSVHIAVQDAANGAIGSVRVSIK